METQRIVIVGAGIVGCSLADELSERGATDVTVLDQGPLFATGGSTSHAPGLCFAVNPSKSVCEMAMYTADKLASLDGAFERVGGLELATTPERVADLQRRHGWATSWGLESHLLDAREARERFDLLDDDVVLAALHTPSDGITNAVPAVEAQARRAAARGVRFLGEHTVLEVLTGSDGHVTGVRTDRGEIDADVVVCCAGFWGPSVARLVDFELPLVAFAHQYAQTGPLPALGQAPATPRPIVRHQSADLYYREHGDRIGIGYYDHRPMPVAQHELLSHAEADVMPSVLPFTPDDFAPAWAESQRMLPCLRDAAPPTGINGIFSFTPDGHSLVGEHRDVPGFWFAEAVWVTPSAGVARAVAQLILDGRSEVALHELDVNRFVDAQRTPDYVQARATRAFVEVYDVLHPLDPAIEPRPLRTTPFYPRQVQAGAVFLEAVGWERPQWYEANAALLDDVEVPARDEWSARNWSPIVAAEAARTRESVAMYDMTALMRLEVAGHGAEGFLQALTTNDVAKPVGTVVYTLLLDEAGGVRSDLTIARLGEERFQVGVNGPLDLDWFEHQRHGDPSVSVRDVTPGTACLGLWGPRARDVIEKLSDDDFTDAGLRYFRAGSASVAGVPVTALRVSYVGELGWELYCSADVGLRLWDQVAAAGAEFGIVPAGRGALDALRIEKGYRSWGKDLTAEYDPYESGLGFAVKPAKGTFTGSAALAAKGEPARRIVPLLLDADDRVPCGSEPVFVEGGACGYVTSAAWCPTIGRVAAYAWLPAEHAEAGTRAEIGYFDERLAAEVATEPLVGDSPGLRSAPLKATA